MKSNNQNDVQHQEEQEEIMDIEQMEQELEEMQTTDLEQCQQDAAMWKDQAARIFADFDNYKKRMERDQASWMQTAQVSVLKDLLSVVDNFDRALSSKNDSSADVYTGIEMIYKSVMQLLHKYGVKEFTDYKTFDPELHEALMDVESADHTSGQIVQVLEKGFMIKDKVLRPAKVMIAK
jgi:molecular chaperone GrpE